jgi:polar amino acid transport system substrate-binding protein
MFILSCLSIVTFTWSAQAETIRLTAGEAPPYLSQSLTHNGYIAQIVTEAFALESIAVEFGFFPWKRAFQYAETGEWDGTLGWIKTPEREKVILFSETPIAIIAVEKFFYRKDDSFDWQTLADLEGLSVGASLGFAHVELLEAAQKAGSKFEVHQVHSELIGLKMLLGGRTDVFPCLVQTCSTLLREQFTLEEQASLAIHPVPLIQEPDHLLISKQSDRAKYWLDAFERGMKKLKESGRYQQMRQDFMK